MKKKISITDWSSVPLVLTTEETAFLLGLNIETIKRLLRSGKLKGTKLGRKWVISKEYLMNLLSTGGDLGFDCVS